MESGGQDGALYAAYKRPSRRWTYVTAATAVMTTEILWNKRLQLRPLAVRKRL